MEGKVDSSYLVSLRNIKKMYFGNLVFDGLDLDLDPGYFYALLGKNGSGKSTLMRILAHREAAASGEGLVLGVDLNHDYSHIGTEIAFISEATYVPPGERISDLVRLFSKIYPKWDQNLAEQLAKGFHFDLTKRAGELSRGQLVQMSLILNLAYSPALILLDEVTAVLDADARAFLMKDLSARVQAGATVLLATNIVTEVQSIANALILIGDKKIKLNAPTEKISAEFLKLKSKNNKDHPIFRKDSCIEVGLSETGEPLYLVSKNDASPELLRSDFLATEAITPLEVFMYLTRLRD